MIGASYGLVELPREAQTAAEALRVADQRMYADKGRRSPRAEQQTHDVLMRTLSERAPALGSHVEGVADLAGRVARELALGAEDIDSIIKAAQLHDIGKIAIPDAILHKPGLLDETEWALMREHTLIGERILAAAPALRKVATLVRSSHERWDCQGYPDGRAGEDIPLGSRIIFVCDAFEAMTADRTYALPMTPDEALESSSAKTPARSSIPGRGGVLPGLESRPGAHRPHERGFGCAGSSPPHPFLIYAFL